MIDAAVRLGYLPDIAPPRRRRPRRRNIDFVLPGGTNTFLKLLSDHLAAMAEARRGEAKIRVHRIDGFDPEALARTLIDLKDGADAIGVLPLDHPLVREAIREVVGGGVPVLTMVSDISNVPRLGYVGIDNRAAGRLAGHLLGRLMQPRGREVALSPAASATAATRSARWASATSSPRNIPAQGGRAARGPRRRRARLCRGQGAARGLSRLAGLYNIGAGNRGIARALEEAGRAGDVTFVCHELTEFTRRLLVAGTVDAVIDQNPRVEARDAVDWLIACARGAAAAGLAADPHPGDLQGEHPQV